PARRLPLSHPQPGHEGDRALRLPEHGDVPGGLPAAPDRARRGGHRGADRRGAGAGDGDGRRKDSRRVATRRSCPAGEEGELKRLSFLGFVPLSLSPWERGVRGIGANLRLDAPVASALGLALWKPKRAWSMNGLFYCPSSHPKLY